MIPDEVLLVWFLMKFCLCDSWWSFISMIPDDAYRSPSLALCIITQVPYNALYTTSIVQLQLHNTWLPAIPFHVFTTSFQLSGRIPPHSKSLTTQFSRRYSHPIWHYIISAVKRVSLNYFRMCRSQHSTALYYVSHNYFWVNSNAFGAWHRVVW